ncbi:hypothetical protein FACS1894202_04570 [Clostridia bacterium]|nr:hypothetical protein FACS1894202_04570 [Clostridia bacterium]
MKALVKQIELPRGKRVVEEDYLSDAERLWLRALPHILESREYIFVHGGLTSDNLAEQETGTCLKNDAFMENGLKFGKYVITGHWPTGNYTHKIQCFNPVVSEEQRIIAIDGGNVIQSRGQLNAFIIQNGAFSFDSADALPTARVKSPQAASGGDLTITWLDRFVELLERGEDFSLYRHIKTGKTILLANRDVWTDGEAQGTDYFLPVGEGDTVSVVSEYSDRILAKKDGTVGWIMKTLL